MMNGNFTVQYNTLFHVRNHHFHEVDSATTFGLRSSTLSPLPVKNHLVFLYTIHLLIHEVIGMLKLCNTVS